MPELELRVGGLYRGKRPHTLPITGEYDDRIILWLSDTHVQYDSFFVRFGRHYPKSTREAFLRWAKEEVADA